MVTMDDATIEPVSASADGKVNTFFHPCSVVGHYRAYAACLAIVDAREAGHLPHIYSECGQALKQGTCRAPAMRQEEVLKGKAIYFRRSMAEAIAAPSTPPVVVTVAPKPTLLAQNTKSPVTLVSVGSYADAINSFAAAAGHVEPPADPIVVPGAAITVQPIKGESPLEFARRVMAASQQPGA